FAVRAASDIALVNLFVRREAFTGFDESIGYIGEDTALLESLMRRGRVLYSDSVRVFHRRRAFPGPYLRQRWRYRVKTGELLVRGSKAHRGNPMIWGFLLVAAITIIASPLAILPYYVAMLIIGARATRLPK